MPDKPTPEEMFKKEEKIEIDPCLEDSIDLIIKSAILMGIGDTYFKIRKLPECKKIVEDQIYHGIIDILEDIKDFEKTCSIPSEFYNALLEEIVEEFGDLKYSDASHNGFKLTEVFRRNISILLFRKEHKE